MLNILRQKRVMKRILVGMAIMIIPAFVLWGPGSPLKSKRSRKLPRYAGKIFGKKISLHRYEESLEAVKNEAIIKYGNRLGEVIEELDFKRQAWERLILLYEAKRKKISVSDAEVVKTISSFPFFQRNGKFDKEQYNRLLRDIFRTDARNFEEQIRESLMISKLQDEIAKNVYVFDDEVLNAYKKEKEKSKIAYILFGYKNFEKGIEVAKKELEKYYKQNSEDLRIPEQVNILYFEFLPEEYMDDVKLSEEQLKQYYTEHKSEFEKDKIYEDLKEKIKKELKKDKADKLALEKAEEINYILRYEKLSMEDVAKKYSIELKESGFFKAYGPIPNIGLYPRIQRLAFKLEKGQRSGIIRPEISSLSKGYYIIKVKDKKESYIPDYNEVKDKIIQILKTKKAKYLSYKKAKKVAEKIKKIMKEKKTDFLTSAKILRFSPKETEPFSRRDYIPEVGYASELGDIAFNNKNKDNVRVKRIRNGTCVFSVLEIIPIDKKKFKEEKDKYKERILLGKKYRVINEWYYDLINRANLQDNLASKKLK